ncbi:lipase family protein [Pectinatus frisingensis]|uniref:lipase family protein n=1 Tax=Pectinatus frisingensis TaxID=865 RepID=UPI0018C745DE|nr:lipase family protein [Pectinatus frisingensis]
MQKENKIYFARGRIMKRYSKVLILLALLIFVLTSIVSAQKNNDAKIQYVSALMSMTAYDDKFSNIAKDTLATYGWKFEFFQEKSNNASAKFFIAHNKKFIPGEDSYLLAIRGTSDLRDVSNDVKISLVPFGGKTPAEFMNFAMRSPSPDLPMVHSGFNNYVQTALFTALPNGVMLGDNLAHILKNNPAAHLYITGHSLGGAAAVLAAARFISLGSRPEQISVITFGAPAVGNELFAQNYGEKLDLARIVMAGDPIRNLAQIFNSNYKLFGTEIKYPSLLSYDDKLRHKILLYVDMSLRRYYDSKVKDQAVYAENGAGILFVRPVFHLPSEQVEEKNDFYMRRVIQDDITHYIKNTDWIDDDRLVTSGTYKYVVHTDVTVERQKYAKNSYYTAITYTVYNARGQLAASFAAADDTEELTPIEAVLYNNIKLRDNLIEALQK